MVGTRGRLSTFKGQEFYTWKVIRTQPRQLFQPGSLRSWGGVRGEGEGGC